jgi:hypothetical protein
MEARRKAPPSFGSLRYKEAVPAWKKHAVNSERWWFNLDKSADSPYPRLSNINKNHPMEDSYGRIKEQRAHPAGAAQQ